jgi:hypothetical protein
MELCAAPADSSEYCTCNSRVLLQRVTCLSLEAGRNKRRVCVPLQQHTHTPTGAAAATAHLR